MHASISSTGNHRARWAAIGAAVAVSLGAGGLGIVKATSPEGASAYVPISPCRLLDTRADSPVGSPLGALGPDTEITVNGWGAQGNCTLPSDSTGLELNVTAVDASTLTNLRIYPEGVDTPTASNLNPAPGEPPTPNSVTAPLNVTNGQFHVFNRFGTVHIVIDVVGYFTDHMHDGDDIIDESLTGADIDDHSVSSADTSNEAGVAFQFTERTTTGLTGNEEVVASVDIRVPSNGYVNVTATLNWSNNDLPPGFDVAMCQITKGTTIDTAQPTFNLNDMDGSLTLAVVGASFHNTLPISADDNPAVIFAGQDINLVCDELVGNVHIYDVMMTAEFFPTEYNPGIFILPPITIVTLAEPAPEG
jgi:hypothetical protein